MTNGIYSIESDIFDSTAGMGNIFITDGTYDNAQSPGQSFVVGVEISGIYTNLSGFIPDGDIAPPPPVAAQFVNFLFIFISSLWRCYYDY